MSGLTNMLTRAYKQTAVYWGNPQPDGSGGFTFDAPVELSPSDNNGVRWEDKKQILGLIGEDGHGERLLSRAVVYVLQDVDNNGLLYLGELADLNSVQKADPMTLEDICIIKRVEKTPLLGSTTEFLRKAYLTPWLS